MNNTFSITPFRPLPQSERGISIHTIHSPPFMKTYLIILFNLLIGIAVGQTPGSGQPVARLWTEADQRYTVENLRRTRDTLAREVEHLTNAQWHFRESPNRWSIAEVVEHLGRWEIAWAREIGEGIRNVPRPDLTAAQNAATTDPDKVYLDFIMEDKPHTAPDFARPSGQITGKNNLLFFLGLREQTIAFADSTHADMRVFYERTGTKFPRNMHQVYIYQWGHVDRHLRQIRQVKQHARYPR